MKEYFKCLACGLEKPNSEKMAKVSTPSLGGEKCRYICRECGERHTYHSEESASERKEFKGRKASLDVRIGIEWEAVFVSEESAAALTGKPYYGVRSDDSSLPMGGEEIKFPPQTLASLSKAIEGWVRFSDPTDPRCGQHINVSVAQWGRNDLWWIDCYKTVLFHELMQLVKRDGDNSFFGRGLNDYARYPFATDRFSHETHYDAIRVKMHSQCIEFRLPKYHEDFTPRRFYLIASMIVEMLEKIDVWFIQKIHGDKDTAKAADKCAEKIAEVYESYQNATARAIKRGVIDWQ